MIYNDRRPEGLQITFNPPYHHLTTTASFTSYTADCFDDDDQIAMAKFVDEIAAKVVVSNSDPKNADGKQRGLQCFCRNQ